MTLIFNSLRQSQEAEDKKKAEAAKAATDADKGEGNEPEGTPPASSEGNEGGEGGGQGNEPTYQEILTSKHGFNDASVKELSSSFGDLASKLKSDGKTPEQIADSIAKLKYAVIMKTSEGQLIASVSTSKSKAQEVISAIDVYVKDKSAENADKIFDVSDDEIEGVDLFTINNSSYLKDKNFAVLNAKSVHTVEV